jgi:hypothetical protein
MPLTLPPSAPSAAQVCEQARVDAQSYTSLVHQVCCLQPTAGRRADPNRGYSHWGETSNQHHSPAALQPSSQHARAALTLSHVVGAEHHANDGVCRQGPKMTAGSQGG